MKIKLITAPMIVVLNERVCMLGKNPSHCYGIGKVESALHSAFYPGTPPFQHGGIATVAGALCYYLCKAHAFADGNKRTALEASIAFMMLNGLAVKYPFSKKTGENALADVVDSCAASRISKENLMNWFDRHKINLI